MILNLSDRDFGSIIAKSKKPVLVDFWSTSCEACRFNAPVADEVSREFRDRLRVGKVNVDDCPYTVGRYNVKMIPSMMLFHHGKLIHVFKGIVTKDAIRKILP